MPETIEMKSPCDEEAATLRKAIDEWVEAAEATREYLVGMSSGSAVQVEPLHPGFFRQMQEAHERELQARLRYIQANNLLYECMERNNLIE
ncbi:MAG: hypothetical protein ACE5JF_00955 [Anaerolineales bacterium]